MNTNTTRHATLNRRHQNPRCACSDCSTFDQSITFPMRRLAPEAFIMTAIDTETSECFTYRYSQGTLHKTPAPSSPSSRRVPEKKSRMKCSFRSLLHDLVIETIEQSVQQHPFFWLCVSRLLR